MKKLLSNYFKVCAVGSVLSICVSSAVGEIVYDNTTTRLNPPRFAQSGFEFGDQVILDGTARTVSAFSFEYDGTNFSGGEMAQVRFYANDSGASQLPGTLLFDSGPFAISATDSPGTVDYATLNFNSLNVDVPNTFTWTVEFSGLTTGNAGLSLYGPPSVGNNLTDYWERSGMGGGWVLRAPNGANPIDFGAQIQAVPEPSVLALSAFAALCGLGLCRRKKS